ncbi:hypothetical protein DL764_006046 [Monosporascus ibericus]|uniref:Amidohydrolase-related domain-containing protein n=1 Tax=Monosporascus ibericus TaxID=155417 RepID=A0A4Q4T9Z6_9PEZI|nr:hypothetical protein DL764_006046 [Monosporascus ibericus]
MGRPSIIRQSNDQLADTIAPHSGHFKARSSIPTTLPREAARELESAVRELGTQELDVPFYIHQTAPEDQTVFAANLATGTWGGHADVGLRFLRFLRLYGAGVFDEIPRLKVVLGHMGEMVPFILERANRIPSLRSIGRATLLEVCKRSNMDHDVRVLQHDKTATLLRNTRVGRITYSVDRPYSSNV